MSVLIANIGQTGPLTCFKAYDVRGELGVNFDAVIGFIHRQTVTPGNAHDSTERDTLFLGDEEALYADAAYSSQATREKLAQFGIEEALLHKSCSVGFTV